MRFRQGVALNCLEYYVHFTHFWSASSCFDWFLVLVLRKKHLHCESQMFMSAVVSQEGWKGQTLKVTGDCKLDASNHMPNACGTHSSLRTCIPGMCIHMCIHVCAHTCDPICLTFNQVIGFATARYMPRYQCPKARILSVGQQSTGCARCARTSTDR